MSRNEDGESRLFVIRKKGKKPEEITDLQSIEITNLEDSLDREHESFDGQVASTTECEGRRHQNQAAGRNISKATISHSPQQSGQHKCEPDFSFSENANCKDGSFVECPECPDSSFNHFTRNEALTPVNASSHENNENVENFSICNKCLSNRSSEFESCEGSSKKLQNCELNSSKEICICAKSQASNVNTSLDEDYIVNSKSDLQEISDQKQCYNISDLPDEIILKIFSYFTPTELCRYVAPVCVSWLTFARDGTLWEEITEKEFKDVSSDLLVKVITSWCSLLRSVDFKGRSDLTLNDFEAVFRSCPQIETISFAFCPQVNDNVLKLFSQNCSHLKYINLEGCNISDASLMYFFGKPIHGLNLSHCNLISDEGLVFLAKNFRDLSCVNLDGIQWITSASIDVLSSLHADHLVQIVLDGAELTDDSIRILSRCTMTRKFSLSFCDGLTDDSLEWIKQFKNLEFLKLKKGLNFSNTAMFSLLKSLKDLAGAGLHYLNLGECSSLSDDCLHAISESCPNLRILDLSWCWEVTDDGISFIFDSCHRIRELYLCGLHELYGIPFRRAAMEMPKLVELDLRQCNKTSDDLLVDLANQMKHLRILNYYGDEDAALRMKFMLQHQAFKQEILRATEVANLAFKRYQPRKRFLRRRMHQNTQEP